MLVGERGELPSLVSQTDPERLEFSLNGGVRPEKFADLRLVPFHRVHDARYMLYWRVVTPDDYETVLEENRRSEAERMALDRLTIDRVAPGEQQSEIEHGFRGEATSTGIWRDRRFRHAEGWFSYALEAKDNRDVRLRLAYFGSDRRHFDVLVNDVLLAEVRLDAPEPDQFIERDYPIPRRVLEAAGGEPITVTFKAKPGSMAGGIFGVRLLKPAVE